MNTKTRYVIVGSLSMVILFLGYMLVSSPDIDTTDINKSLCEQGETAHINNSEDLIDCYRWRSDYLMVKQDTIAGRIEDMEAEMKLVTNERKSVEFQIDEIKCNQLQHNEYCLGKSDSPQ